MSIDASNKKGGTYKARIGPLEPDVEYRVTVVSWRDNLHSTPAVTMVNVNATYVGCRLSLKQKKAGTDSVNVAWEVSGLDIATISALNREIRNDQLLVRDAADLTHDSSKGSVTLLTASSKFVM